VSTVLIEHSAPATNGARAVRPFVIAGAQYLIVPQLQWMFPARLRI